MPYEYKVVPAPARGAKRKGARTAEDRFALTIEAQINTLAAEGWEYLRCDTLPSEERSGLTQTQTVWRNLLVFRRGTAAQADAPTPPRMLTAPRTDEGDDLDTAEDTTPDGQDTNTPLPGILRARARQATGQD
ncbi:DUF4177 domain-containing protein [Thetidibacter halocola]|uniref:DUF4177 domain-containing protein n=1 Tax=Thetidibacter halocola TaxID=2827239 RepID=A0A8J8B5Q0_9RHOB|nr:DUF4177 domain-containing protein [Thetidibacter halocola]MBS0123166.1 DUF4177 domain-containing protein [Thetidibacter halocola]